MTTTRLIKAARAVIAAEDMKPEGLVAGAAWLRWEADKMEAREAAFKELREALMEVDE